MKKYLVNVNGTDYEISVEEIKEGAAPAEKPAAAPAPVAAPKAAPAPAAAPAAPSGDGEEIKCPMPGTILAVNVNVGDTVKSGDTLAVLEAMKMENEIQSPKDGKVTYVGVTKGATAESGTVLFKLA